MFQTWPVVLCIQNSVISAWITSLYVSQPSSVVFACKTTSFGPELQVSMGPRPHLSFCACKTTWFAPEWQVYMGSSPHLWFCACKTATLGPDLQVCKGPRHHLWFWGLITAFLSQEWLHCFQPSPVVLCMQNSDFRTRITRLCGSKTPPVAFACKTATSGPE